MSGQVFPPEQQTYSGPGRILHRNQCSKNQLKTTCMLLVVSTVFVVLNAPSHAFKILNMVKDLKQEDYKISDTALIWQEVFQLIYYMNFSINFFLYSAYAKRFRQGLRRLWEKVVPSRCVGGRHQLLAGASNNTVMAQSCRRQRLSADSAAILSQRLASRSCSSIQNIKVQRSVELATIKDDQAERRLL